MKQRVSCAGAILAILGLGCLANFGCAGVSSAHSGPPTFSMSGTITPATNGGGVTVTLSGTASASTTTDSSGNYSFTGLASGDYTLTPTKTGFSFSPSNQSVALTASVTGIDFTASSGPGSGLGISGNISPATEGAGVTVTLSGAVSATTITGSAGNYSFDNLVVGDYTLTPSKSGLTFSPSSQSATISSASVTEVNFTASASGSDLSISGNISPIANGTGVTVSLSGADSASTTTDAAGNYSFAGLAGGNYTLTPSKSGFSFSPSKREITTTSSNIVAINFVVYAVSQLSPPLVLNGENGTVIDGLTITSTSGNCVTITNSTNITIQNSEIGPCKGNGIVIQGGSGINVYDSYIHPETQAQICCDHNDGILMTGTTKVTIQGNVIAYGESNVEAQSSSSISVIGNFLLNPRNNGSGNWSRGNNFQSWRDGDNGAVGSNMLVENNYILSSQDTTAFLYPDAQADSVSFGWTNGGTVENNYITGGTFEAGCGVNADDQANSMTFKGNKLVDTGGCGLEISNGTNQLVTGNRVLNRDPVNGAGNRPISVQNFYDQNACGPVMVSANIATAYQLDGSQSGIWQGQGCAPVTVTNDNVFGEAADGILTPVDEAPLVPPQPKNCVVISPYSTQTSSSACTR